MYKCIIINWKLLLRRAPIVGITANSSQRSIQFLHSLLPAFDRLSTLTARLRSSSNRPRDFGGHRS